jgi:hypothetical protein
MIVLAVCVPVSAEPVTVEVSREVRASMEAVRGRIADPELARASPYVRSVEVAPAAGGCVEVVVWTGGPVGALSYRALRCLTADGVRERLLQSEDFAAHEAIWRIVPTSAGTRVTLRVTTEPRVPVPPWILRWAVTSSGEALLDVLAAEVAAP